MEDESLQQKQREDAHLLQQEENARQEQLADEKRATEEAEKLKLDYTIPTRS